MQILWTLPVPSSGRTNGPDLGVEPGRTHTLTFECENYEGSICASELRFSDVKAFRCWYLHALTAEMIETSYDRLVDLGDTEWLREVKEEAATYAEGGNLRHLRICFDDGPCYEFACVDFRISTQAKL